MFLRKAMNFVPILLLSATACGAPGGAGNGGSSDPLGSSAYPSVLLGTWESNSEGVKFAADGACIQKYWGDVSHPCTYLVSTGDVDQPSADHLWVLQVDEKEDTGGVRAWSAEIVALGPSSSRYDCRMAISTPGSAAPTRTLASALALCSATPSRTKPPATRLAATGTTAPATTAAVIASTWASTPAIRRRGAS